MILQILNDTLTNVVSEVVNTGIAVHEMTGGAPIIKGVDNSVVGGILTLLIAGVVRYFEKRKLKRKYGK